jgi:hypothetical protein
MHTYVHSYLYTEICQKVSYTSKINEYHETVEILKSMQTTIQTLENRYDSIGYFFITINGYTCMYVQPGQYAQVSACMLS